MLDLVPLLGGEARLWPEPMLCGAELELEEASCQHPTSLPRGLDQKGL